MTAIPDPSSIPLMDDATVRRTILREQTRSHLLGRATAERDQRFLDALNRGVTARTRRLVRRHRDLTAVYETGRATGSQVLDLACAVLVLRQRGVRVPCDETVDRVLEAVLAVSRDYRYSTDPGSHSEVTRSTNQTGTP